MVVAVESLVVVLGALLGTEVASSGAWLEVARDVTDRSTGTLTARKGRIGMSRKKKMYFLLEIYLKN